MLSDRDIEDIKALLNASSFAMYDMQWGAYGATSLEELADRHKETLSHSPSLIVHSVFYGDPEEAITVALTGNGPTSEANAKFIVFAGKMIRELLDERELLLRRIKEMEQQGNEM